MTKTNSIFLLLTLFFVTGFRLHTDPPVMKSLFNGKDLSGWVEPADNQWWTAHEGILSAKSDEKKTGSILWTEQAYENFIFQTDFKMGDGIVDSGIFLKTEDLQIQIGISGSQKRDLTGSPYIPGKGYPVEAKGVKPLLRAEAWNTLKIQYIGQECTVWLNGQQILAFSEPTQEKGPVGLQLHPGNTMHIDFRNIMLAEL